MGISKHPLFAGFAGDGNEPDFPIDEASIRRLQTSFAHAVARGDQLADRFYARLFASHPEVRALFPADMANQKDKLFATLAEVVTHLGQPRESKRALAELGRDHVGFGARAEHYPLVCKALVDALAEISGPAWNAELDREWRLMLDLVSAIMVEGARQSA